MRSLLAAVEFFTLFAMFPRSTAISIDNDIIGDPDIECLDDQIRVFVKTRKIFAGRIYAKGKADNPDCSKDDFARERTKKPHMDLRFGMCGMKSLRSIDPRGMYYGITLVVSFHTMFITKVDQAFHVKCFFEEASRGLTAELGVSMIPTTEVEARHTIPGCVYSIHASSIDDLDSGKPAGIPIQFARVGDKVLHQWHCDDQMFGILINNCYVTDGFGKRADVVDSKGCAVDPILITGIRYSPDLQRAYAESQVFKFADRPGVWFFCQIQMCMKKAGMCDGITPPTCASMALGGIVGSASSEVEGIEEEMETNAIGKGYGKGALKTSKDFRHNGYMRQSAGPRRTTESFQYTGPSSYGITGAAEDYETKEQVTAFGPGFPVPNAFKKDGLHYGPSHKAIFGNTVPTTERPRSPTAVVTTIFETNEAYVEQKYGSTSPGTTARSAYTEYEDEGVTIPANLNDLLANLPDDVSADSLQKMFRDSVEDRRALLQGFDLLMNHAKPKNSNMPKRKPNQANRNNTRRIAGQNIDSMQVSWGSPRLADEPLDTENDDERMADVRNEKMAEPPFDLNAPPMIAGRLLIYDLDEEPPNAAIKAERELSQKSHDVSECAISRQGLFMLASCLGTLCALMFILTVLMYIRLSRVSRFSRESSYEQSSSVRQKRLNEAPCERRSISESLTKCNRLRAAGWS
uniref:ZP domain-containing protein n=1 Tax=Ascaris lumbricoides TaxID=6252 RepID=A0A9J2P679_ASCLU